jgi:hypothetical protein
MNGTGQSTEAIKAIIASNVPETGRSRHRASGWPAV